MDNLVLIEDLDTSEQDSFMEVTYKGKPFTGTAYDDTEHTHSEYQYENGYGQGRCFIVFDNGQLQEEFYLEKGKVVSERIWLRDGTLIENYQARPLLMQEYYKEGSKKSEKTDVASYHWYQNGQLKKEFIYSNGFSTYYAKDGTWIVRHQSENKNYLILSREFLEFNNEYLSEHYLELLEDIESFYMYFVRWLPEVVDSKNYIPDEYITKIISSMISSDNLHIKYAGMNLAETYNVKSIIPLLKKELTNTSTPSALNQSSYGWSIAERAKVAIERLEGI